MEESEKHQLTEEKIQEFIRWLEERQEGQMKCPLCSKDHWLVAEYLIAPPTASPGATLIPSGPTYPMIPVFCTNCGYTSFFNAIISGVVDADPLKARKGKNEKDPKDGD